MAGLEPFGGHGNLHNHVLVNLGNLPAFSHHALGVGGGGLHFATDGAVYDRGNLGHHLLEVAAFFGDERRVGGHTANHAHVVGHGDLLNVCCV